MSVVVVNTVLILYLLVCVHLQVGITAQHNHVQSGFWEWWNQICYQNFSGSKRCCHGNQI